MKVIILMGSKADIEHCRKIKACLDLFSVQSVLRVASAHKVPLKAMEIIRQLGKKKISDKHKEIWNYSSK